MATQFDKLRTIGRVAPKTPATAAVFQDGQKLAYGVVINMSVTGACIVTDHRLVEGHDMTLKLSLYKQAELFEIPARIVWVRKGGARELGAEGLQLHGVKFTESSATLKARLHNVLGGDAFVDVFSPSTELDVLQSELAVELKNLGAKMNQTTGDES